MLGQLSPMLLTCAGASMRTHQAVWETHWSPWLLFLTQEQGLVLVWAEPGVVLGGGQDRSRRRVGLAPTPVHAEGAPRPWGMEVWTPSIPKVTQPVLGLTSALLGFCTL